MVCFIDIIYPPRHHKVQTKGRKDENSDSGQESVSNDFKYKIIFDICIYFINLRVF